MLRDKKYITPFDGALSTIMITYDDIFHLKNLYKYCYLWLIENGFKSPGGDLSFEYYYLEKVGQAGTEYWMKWKAQQDATKYARYILDIKFHLILIQKVEIMHEGKKLKMNKGEVNIEIGGKVILDYNQAWSKHWLLKHWKDTYDRKIMAEEMDEHPGNLYNLIYDLQNTIKQYLALRCYQSPQAFFHETAQGRTK